MNKIYDRLLNKEVTLKENTLWYTIGTLCSSATSFLLMIYVTRILGVDQAGVFSISYSVGQLMLSIDGLALDNFKCRTSTKNLNFPIIYP